MSIATLDDLKLATGKRLLGLDLGEKTIGLALSDTSRSVATPMETLRRSKFGVDAEKIEKIVAEHSVGAIEIGLPLNMDGSDGPSSQSARAIGRNLAARHKAALVVRGGGRGAIAGTRAGREPVKSGRCLFVCAHRSPMDRNRSSTPCRMKAAAI